MCCRKAAPIPRSHIAKTRCTTSSEDAPGCKSVPTTPRWELGQLFSSRLNWSIGSTTSRKSSKCWCSLLLRSRSNTKRGQFGTHARRRRITWPGGDARRSIDATALLGRRLCRHPIHLFFYVLFLETEPLQDALPVLYHLRMPA